jgi:hypothetical protein
MTNSSYCLVRKVSRRTQFLMLFILLTFVLEAQATHQLAVNPSQPTSENTITILATGNWPSGGAPSLKQWSKSGQSIRIDALGILPGIQQPIVPYQLDIDLGQLPPGQYQADYYVEVLAAPGPPPGMAAFPPLPDATISFEVLAAAEPMITEPIPTLSPTAFALLILLILFMPQLTSRKKYKESAKSNQRLGTR